MTPDFSLALSTASISITGGGSASFTATVTGSYGFTSAVSLAVIGLPSGVTVTPVNPQATPGTPLQLTISAASSVTTSTATLTVTGTSGTLSHSSQIGLSVQSNVVPTLPTRTRYVRTDAATEYFLSINSSWIVFDPITNHFLVSDPGNNQVIVLDAAKQAKIASIPVPGAYSLDETPDHTRIYVATQIGDVYVIDPVAMAVTQRYLASQIGPVGFQAYAAYVLASGKLALLGGQGGIPSVDGYSSFAIWNPADNSILVYGNSFTNANRANCVQNIGAFTVSGDRTLVIEASIDSDNTLCTINPETGATNSARAGSSFLYHVLATPDGNSILITDYNSGNGGKIDVIDLKTLTQKTSFPVAGDTSSAASLTVSSDSKTLYISGGGMVYAYNIASGSLLGWTPNLIVEAASGGGAVGSSTGPQIQAMDGTGLLAGPMEEGVGFIDVSALHSGSVGTSFSNAYIAPPTGSALGGTQISWNGSSSGTISQVFVGGSPATSVSNSSGTFYATTPAGTPGPADLYAVMADGGIEIVPEGFSYGPTLLQATPNYSTSDGGGMGILFGYGFGSTLSTTTTTNMTVTVGGKSATVTGYAPNAYGLLSPPFLLQAVSYTIPAGTAGTSSDIAVTTAAGTATLSGGMHYLPPAQLYPLSGAVLAQGVYDSRRDLYYFTDAASIQVFSRAKGGWQTPISIPAAPAGTPHRLWGIALSPDGSKMAVSDWGAAMIYLIDPDAPASVKAFAVPGPYFSKSISSTAGLSNNPMGLEISNAGVVYFCALPKSSSGWDGYFSLNTSSGVFTDLGVTAGGVGNGIAFVVLSADGIRVYFNNSGYPFSIDTTTGAIFQTSGGFSGGQGNLELSLSSNQTSLAAAGYFFDADLNPASYEGMNMRESSYIGYVYGAKMSPDGSLFFQPSTNGIDVFDGRLGILRNRIALPFALSQNYDALVADGKDNVLLAITGIAGSGIAIIDLSSVSEPGPLPYQSEGVSATQRPTTPGYSSRTNMDSPIRKSSSPGPKIPYVRIKHVVYAPMQ
ncbi:MAG: IPT/TIG domain-containing protein [Terracidiphilus sp.]|nr:IPT/TIG domain-containing protein [Terracidiphilus sp.]